MYLGNFPILAAVLDPSRKLLESATRRHSFVMPSMPRVTSPGMSAPNHLLMPYIPPWGARLSRRMWQVSNMCMVGGGGEPELMGGGVDPLEACGI